MASCPLASKTQRPRASQQPQGPVLGLLPELLAAAGPQAPRDGRGRCPQSVASRPTCEPPRRACARPGLGDWGGAVGGARSRAGGRPFSAESCRALAFLGAKFPPRCRAMHSVKVYYSDGGMCSLETIQNMQKPEPRGRSLRRLRAAVPGVGCGPAGPCTFWGSGSLVQPRVCGSRVHLLSARCCPRTPRSASVHRAEVRAPGQGRVYPTSRVATSLAGDGHLRVRWAGGRGALTLWAGPPGTLSGAPGCAVLGGI